MRLTTPPAIRTLQRKLYVKFKVQSKTLDLSRRPANRRPLVFRLGGRPCLSRGCGIEEFRKSWREFLKVRSLALPNDHDAPAELIEVT